MAYAPVHAFFVATLLLYGCNNVGITMNSIWQQNNGRQVWLFCLGAPLSFTIIAHNQIVQVASSVAVVTQ